MIAARLFRAGSRTTLVAVALTVSSRAAVGQTPMTGVEQARADSIRRPYTAADIAFMSGMIPHHAQAVKMAGWAPTHGASPAVQILCERQLVSQRDEIAMMRTWLRDRGLPVPAADATRHR